VEYQDSQTVPVNDPEEREEGLRANSCPRRGRDGGSPGQAALRVMTRRISRAVIGQSGGVGPTAPDWSFAPTLRRRPQRFTPRRYPVAKPRFNKPPSSFRLSVRGRLFTPAPPARLYGVPPVAGIRTSAPLRGLQALRFDPGYQKRPLCRGLFRNRVATPGTCPDTNRYFTESPLRGYKPPAKRSSV
jgi:hypothetical protein